MLTFYWGVMSQIHQFFPSVDVTSLATQHSQMIQVVSLIVAGNERFKFAMTNPFQPCIDFLLLIQARVVAVGRRSSDWGGYKHLLLYYQTRVLVLESISLESKHLICHRVVVQATIVHRPLRRRAPSK